MHDFGIWINDSLHCSDHCVKVARSGFQCVRIIFAIFKFRSFSFLLTMHLTQFSKPGSREDFDYPQMVKESVTKCLADAKLSYKCIEQACVGYVYGDSTCGQRCLYEFGFTGIPIYNVHNNCSTGSTALIMGYQLIRGGVLLRVLLHPNTVDDPGTDEEKLGNHNVRSGLADCVLAVGFEKMERGSLGSKYDDRENPIELHMQVLSETRGVEAAPITAQMFGAAGLEHMEKYGTKVEHFAKIAEKNHRHSCNNPYSQFQKEYSLEEILSSPVVSNPLTKLQCCPTSDGSAAVIIASEKFVKDHFLELNAVEILGMEMTTDFPSSFDDKNVKPTDVDVIELHDCFSTNELLTYEALGLCGIGEGSKLVDSGNNTYGGKYVINPSGGLISKGHPLGATGIAQCVELCWQLRGLADKRQVPNAKLALQHNIGLGGASIVALYASYKNNNSKIAMVKLGEVSPGKGFKVEPIFKIIADQLRQDGARYVKRMKGIFLFQVTDGPNKRKASWIVDAKNGTGSVKCGEGKSDVTLTISDKDLFDLMLGKLNPQKVSILTISFIKFSFH
ncbi:Non-specific lipid-transfer protein [Nymphon striatum]|nr:Non-specific lipid-transfer protein [Nymphon striatum]